MRIRLAPALLALALSLAAPSPTGAQPPPDDAEASARALGAEALVHFQAGRWQPAHDLFEQADKRFHAPTLVLYMGHCQARLGHLVAARRHYQEVVKEPLPPGAPAQFRTAQTIAAEELRWTEQRLGILKIAVTGVPAAEARVLVDRVEVPSPELDDVAVLPGEHRVEASAAGGELVQRTLTVTAGHTAEVQLAVTPPSSAPAVSAAPTPTPAPVPAPERKDAGPHGGHDLLVPAIVSFGVGGGALVVGTVIGAISLRAAGDVKSRCSLSGDCPAAAQPDAASAGRLADVSTGALVVGSAGVVTGIVLSVLYARGREAPAAGAVHVEAGPGSVTLRGAF